MSQQHRKKYRMNGAQCDSKLMLSTVASTAFISDSIVSFMTSLSADVSSICLTQTGYFYPNLSTFIPWSDGVTGGGQGSMDGTERPIILTEFPHSCVHLSPSDHQSFF